MTYGKLDIQAPRAVDLGDSIANKQIAQIESDTTQQICNSPKIRVYINEESCKDLALMPNGQVEKVCQITINGFRFSMTKGPQDIPEFIAEHIFGSLDNAKYATYGGSYAPKSGIDINIDNQPYQINSPFQQNLQAAQQFSAATNPYGL